MKEVLGDVILNKILKIKIFIGLVEVGFGIETRKSIIV